ncbi:DUF4241 domain-containing protein [Brevibacillus reuszeri]|uniref:DUF4241 domain-containing protein n=1 Tax=Brevibacillus reuszeri TaxID=54915 RepID=UPI0028963711|nr:DUF4241 domain-containing protein [Brevibacillus reuszeri]
MNATYPKLFETAFEEGTTFEQDHYEYRLYCQDLGKLKVKTGKIVANDPFVLFETEPFQASFPKGEFPVQLAIAKVAAKAGSTGAEEAGESDERVAFAQIVFANKPVASWKMAVWENSDMSQLGPNEFFGYGVDSGTGSFMDASTCELFEKASEKDDTYMDKLSKEMDHTYKHTRCWLVKEVGEGNVMMFSTGWGDGSYASYIGFDANGEIVRLLTDFYLYNWMELEVDSE